MKLQWDLYLYTLLFQTFSYLRFLILDFLWIKHANSSEEIKRLRLKKTITNQIDLYIFFSQVAG